MPRTYGTNPPKYTDLSDVPPSLSGDANKVVAVNTTASGLEHRILTSTDIPSLDASKITTGTLDPTIIPDLSANKITSDTLSVDRIPNLSANKITSDLIGTARLATGTANSTTFLRGDQTWQTISSGGVTVQANPPTNTTNATLGSQIYALNTDRKYVCIDATTNANVWAFWNQDGTAGGVPYTYPGGTLTNDASANTSPNDVIANTDILYAIGTNYGASAYTNPIDGVRISQTNSGVEPGWGDPTVLADRRLLAPGSGNYSSTNVASSWFSLNFGASVRVNINKVAIQQRNDSAHQLHRTLVIQYRNDGINFTTATSFTASNGQGDWSLFDVTGFLNSQYLRIIHTSVNSNGSNNFTAAELLLWGTIVNV